MRQCRHKTRDDNHHFALELLLPERFGLQSARHTKEADIFTHVLVVYEVDLLSGADSQTTPNSLNTHI